MANDKLQRAKDQKNDEFYTQYFDIEAELNNYLEYNPDVFRGKTILLPCDDPEWSNFTKYFAQNFDRFGLKKLISTSYAIESKKYKVGFQLSLFETEDPQYDPDKSKTNGKIFVLERKGSETKIDINNLEWHYLEGDGDFRSEEVTKLRDEADIIVTNPPFTLFKEFVYWILAGNKQFITIGNLNAIKYSEIFPLLMEDKIWRVNGVRWFTNVDHGRRHESLQLMNMADNLKYNQKLINKLKNEYNSDVYPKLDLYDALEVPFVDAIPSDYDGVMSVPISFMDKYCPEQFEIVGEFNHGSDNDFDLAKPSINGVELYPRIAIRFRR